MRLVLAVLLVSACGHASSNDLHTTPTASASASSAPPPPSASAAPAPSATALVIDGPTSGSVRRGCDHKGYVTPPGAKPTIVLGARKDVLDVSFINEGTAPVCVFTHVQADVEHFDWIRVVVDGGPAPVRDLTFVDDRNRSARVSYELGPGARLTKTIDLGSWARRRMNGGRTLNAGTYNASLTYDSSHETTAWAGTLHARTTMTVARSLLTDP